MVDMAKRKLKPTVIDNIFELPGSDADIVIREDITTRLGEQAWLRFLKSDERAFRYILTNKDGSKLTFTAWKENIGHGRVWRAHRRVGGKLRRKYLGKAENLTAKKLRETAEYLAQTKF